MAIIIRDVSDDEIPRVCAIEHAAYADNLLSPFLFPGPFPADSQQQRVTQLIDMRKTDSTARYIQAYDEETGQLIAFAKWHVYDSSSAAAAARRPARNFGPGTNVEACEAFFGSLSTKKDELMGEKPHLYLHMLHTDPSFQGRGAGKILVEWGTKEADELGLPAYLESSPSGHHLYRQCGFHDVDMLKLDLGLYGGEGVYEEPLMIREPITKE
ncbi:acyl-CoA N-acyltransferase [Ophiobolus disseminans]|uniref:Acyl-CoA N-acyltransferase n=1 Tax=Ophiobolus disseminans TaxID=1469910 RepID=A0A6A6ZSA6_9PLEO|nr:acyl-CoA N-acyltransferase [Ophiobolus disseminans]